jgi:two-component system CheB/CheR fusion protein
MARKSSRRGEGRLKSRANHKTQDPKRATLKESIAAETKTACPVIGIGGSAGAIDSLQRFFSAADPAAGVAYVVIMHLDPNHPSNLPEVLSRFSTLTVRGIEQGEKVEPNHVYVIRPNTAVSMDKCRFVVSKPQETRGQRMPIDSFLMSLASDQGENAACVILSGSGSDGTLGLRAIKEHGGLALAQEAAE